jgi:hypothetical protein
MELAEHKTFFIFSEKFTGISLPVASRGDGIFFSSRVEALFAASAAG